MRLGILALILCLAGCSTDTDLAQRRTLELQGGAWKDVTTRPSQVLPEPTLDRAEQMLFAGNFRPARELLLDWEKSHKDSPVRDRCIYLLGEAFFQSDDRIKSFYYYDELMDEYRQSSLFGAALQKQFEIADAYLHGYKRVLIWFRILDASDEGIEMLFRIQQRAPGSPLAEKALLDTADYYYGDQDFDLAVDAYNAYMRQYPRSPQIPTIKLHAAFSSLAQFTGVHFDPTSIIDARAQLLDIQRNYPQLASDENVPAVVERIDSALARKILDTGEFYERTHEPKAAVYQYRLLILTYPNSAEAQAAQGRLAKAKPENLTGPQPAFAQGFVPSTMPSAPVEIQ